MRLDKCDKSQDKIIKPRGKPPHWPLPDESTVFRPEDDKQYTKETKNNKANKQ